MINSNGSTWRKWDLHVHLPGTKLSDGYLLQGEGDVIDKFCDEIESSDVMAFGITDYFSVDGYFRFTEAFYKKYPDSEKVFFPNIELRLNESVNSAVEEVNIHLLLSSEVSEESAKKLLERLETEITDGNERKLACSELTTLQQYQSATVSRENIKKAIRETFGEKAVRQDHVLVVTAANNDGLRPQRGSHRKENITDQIDKFSDGYFGGSQNVEYFLRTNRLEDTTQISRPKPVFAGSDAHSFNDIASWLGKRVKTESVHKEVTWVKSNPTFEGLRQTLIEPAERVRIQELLPDEKEPYKRISKISFEGTNDFPSEIVFNPNLCSIIGSRSSGKSSLLSYIAYAIDPQDTIERQMAAQEITDPSKVGPAAGKTWRDVSRIKCHVEWGTGVTDGGRVIYIPQNYLYSISKRPSEITKKIKPVLFTNYPTVKAQYEKTEADALDSNTLISDAVSEWFDADGSIKRLQNQISNLGDKKSIEKARDDYKSQIDDLKKTLSLSQEDVDAYQAVSAKISTKQMRVDAIDRENLLLAQLYDDSDLKEIHASVTFRPALDSMPPALVDKVNASVDEVKEKLEAEVAQTIVTYVTEIASEQSQLKKDIEVINETNKDLIEKYQKNAQLTQLVEKHTRQEEILASISTQESEIAAFEVTKKESVEAINGAILSRSQAFLALSQAFSGLSQSQTDMTFGAEVDFSSTTIEELSDLFNRKETSPYLKDGLVVLDKARAEANSFLEYMQSSQKLKINQEKKAVATDVLCATEEIRFNATLEGDRIGGFALSSMTPGKQALFALTLILDESDDAWPLLIDQPEDDLDSRSIYDYIVPYMMHSKRDRQILMVSHNANLVVGADSEQLIIANRHGVDRKNRGGNTFDYLTGALEDTKEKDAGTGYVLESCGIREHAIDILDGGKEAFEKRRDKYKV